MCKSVKKKKKKNTSTTNVQTFSFDVKCTNNIPQMIIVFIKNQFTSTKLSTDDKLVLPQFYTLKLDHWGQFSARGHKAGGGGNKTNKGSHWNMPKWSKFSVTPSVKKKKKKKKKRCPTVIEIVPTTCWKKMPPVIEIKCPLSLVPPTCWKCPQWSKVTALFSFVPPALWPLAENWPQWSNLSVQILRQN